MRRGIRLRGAHVLITGGSSGIGKQMAFAAARRGADVTIWARNLDAAEAVCALITGAGGSARAQRVDVSDRDAVTAAAADAGPIDVLINSAGVVSGTRLIDTPADRIRATFDVNVLALYWTTQTFLPGMIERRRGTIVTIASASSLVGIPRQTDYSASKWAAFGFTEALRKELRVDGHPIGTLIVCPTYIDTGMFAGVTPVRPRMMPMLKERDVARRTIDAIERGHQLLLLPPSVRSVWMLRALPVPLFDRITDLMGIDTGMDGFTGRPRAPRVGAEGA